MKVLTEKSEWKNAKLDSNSEKVLPPKSEWKIAKTDSNFDFGSFCSSELLTRKKVFEMKKEDSNNYSTIHMKNNMDYFYSTRVRARVRGTRIISSNNF